MADILPLRIPTEGRGAYEITRAVQDLVETSDVDSGLCTVFVHHTSASLLICENADPQVLRDLEAWFQRAVPDGDPMYGHTAEGPDDMPAHVRSVLTQTSIGIPVIGGTLALGTWQGLFLWEHRTAAHMRKVSVVIS